MSVVRVPVIKMPGRGRPKLEMARAVMQVRVDLRMKLALDRLAKELSTPEQKVSMNDLVRAALDELLKQAKVEWEK
jgi:hypothetical protein